MEGKPSYFNHFDSTLLTKQLLCGYYFHALNSILEAAIQKNTFENVIQYFENWLMDHSKCLLSWKTSTVKYKAHYFSNYSFFFFLFFKN